MSLPSRRSAPSWLLDPSVLIPLYVLLIIGGYLLFFSGQMTRTGNEMSRQQSLFTAANAATLTGFQQARSVNDYRPAGQWVTLALMLAGTLFSLVSGGLAVARIGRVSVSDKAIALGAAAFTAGVAAIALAAAPLWHQALFASVYQLLSAWGNCGLIVGRLPTADSAWTQLLLLPLSVAGSLGVVVLLDVLRHGSAAARHTRVALAATAAGYLASVIVLVLAGWMGSTAAPSWPHLLSRASAQAINARSTGFPFEFASYQPRTVQWVTIGLMLIGGCSGGTAGGVKLTTLAVLAAGVAGCFRSSVDRSPNRWRLFGLGLLWVAGYLLALGVVVVLLLGTEPQMSADRVLFLAASALGNVGLSHDPVTVSDPGLYVLSGAMLVGRIAPILVLWAAVDLTTGESQSDEEELVAVG